MDQVSGGGRISLLLGAGFSYPFKYPTTKQFYENLIDHISNKSQVKLLENLKSIKGIVDIEHVLKLLDCLYLDAQVNALELLNKVVPRVNLSGSDYSYYDFLDVVKGLRGEVINSIFDVYRFNIDTKEKSFASIDELFRVIDPYCASSLKDVYTLNYDRLIEQYLIEKNVDFLDGFSLKGRRWIWNSQNFTFYNENPLTLPIRLFKLHGSLDWTNWKDGSLERLSTEERSTDRTYRENVFIYPTEGCDMNKEPYKTLFGHFKEAGQVSRFLIVIGYSFRDKEINDEISYFQKLSGNKVIVISPTVDEDLATSNLNSKPFIKIKSKFAESQTLTTELDRCLQKFN